jgi:hypothetical protein
VYKIKGGDYMDKENHLSEILDEILLFDNEIEKLNMELRFDLLSKNKIDTQIYLRKLNIIIKNYGSSLSNFNNTSQKNITTKLIH